MSWPSARHSRKLAREPIRLWGESSDPVSLFLGFEGSRPMSSKSPASVTSTQRSSNTSHATVPADSSQSLVHLDNQSIARLATEIAQRVTARPLLLSASSLATMLQVSKRTLWRLHSAGRLPHPVRIGSSVRWKLHDVEEWIEGGCPDEHSTKKMKSKEADRGDHFQTNP
jgi:excisionase family DNA binding protein